MKSILITSLSVLFLLSCGKTKKQNTPENAQKAITLQVAKEQANTANIMITANDAMSYNTNEIKVKAGQNIKLTLKHIGKLDKTIMGHNVVIVKQGINLVKFAANAASSKANDYIPEGTNDVIAHTKMIGGGETTTIEFTAPKAGIYDFICSFPAHYALMKGKFIVE